MVGLATLATWPQGSRRCSGEEISALPRSSSQPFRSRSSEAWRAFVFPHSPARRFSQRPSPESPADPRVVETRRAPRRNRPRPGNQIRRGASPSSWSFEAPAGVSLGGAPTVERGSTCGATMSFLVSAVRAPWRWGTGDARSLLPRTKAGLSRHRPRHRLDFYRLLVVRGRRESGAVSSSLLAALAGTSASERAPNQA